LGGKKGLREKKTSGKVYQLPSNGGAMVVYQKKGRTVKGQARPKKKSLAYHPQLN